MSILKEIVEHKKKEVAKDKSLYPITLLEQSIHFDAPCVSLSEYILRPDKVGIIAEFKRKSPSKGAINLYASPEEVSIGYMQAGASAISVLTDKNYFGGSKEDLKTVRKYNFCPILRKEFIIDEYQILEAKSIGADAILLIASILTDDEIKKFTSLAKSLGLEILFEVHDEEEIGKFIPEIDLIGVNNRNLKTFKTDFNYSLDIFNKLPTDAVKISESGINDPKVVSQLKTAGYDGFLIGEYFMAGGHPEEKCKQFIDAIKNN
ncbi:indole-3-glycerol phosphate synthase TrpC [Portibacter lacus]|uniref:Indole-3-glycerol phosphate synthase n=1 Tax=Portibacter lacus TaxID=1099794 RepID=A0AA37STC6_9BACT|nr:indole-3-glycerol phosphate synthase TrpC [Portibacter lacus]GLR19294.1 indole-3-glycerol phosphate synthase [Portibacter lacus]